MARPDTGITRAFRDASERVRTLPYRDQLHRVHVKNGDAWVAFNPMPFLEAKKSRMATVATLALVALGHDARASAEYAHLSALEGGNAYTVFARARANVTR